jgi:NADPH2:quinone reductase
MRVMAVRRAGGPDVLELVDVPEPTPGPGQALVEVHAGGVNFMDIGVRQGLFWTEMPYPKVLGVEGAGRVRAVGEGVDAIRPGERVAWVYAPGSYAEHVIVPAAALVPLPDAIDDRTAAAVMMQGLTASHFATDFYPVQPGDVALVHAAAGGVGLLLTQIIKLRGGRVIGRVSRQEKVHAAIEAGADHVIVGTEGDFADEVIRLSGGDGVHVVYDGSGPTTFQGSLASLRRSGTFCWYGPVLGAPGPIDIMSLPHSIKIGYAVFSDHVPTPEALRARSEQLFDWILRGELKVRIGATYPLAHAARAHADMEARGTVGKLLLLPEDAA